MEPIRSSTPHALNELLTRPDDAYASEGDLENAGIAAIATLRDWATRHRGPPRTRIRRRPMYRIGALRKWLLACEQDFDALRQRRPLRQRSTSGEAPRAA